MMIGAVVRVTDIIIRGVGGVQCHAERQVAMFYTS